ncbi:hypothetical protein [Streptomyces sp. TLI_185]|uniref:hypothetical protein n=1 Tax=Streptomyces sp. TLI_185 TaxID=2485151 RepID=UPI000FB9774A|nr:hypothetical protein [Streptomyces sp. TLI_185]RPF35639.1 hypothetical protein EDD92_5658 [Streptomyces sp. TLI_185]
MSLAAAMAFGLAPKKATAELHKRFKEILKRDGLSPWEIAYLRGKIEKWPPGYAEQWAAGYAEGRAAVRAEGILSALEARGIAVPANVRERIASCTDLDALALWLDRSLTVTTADDLFGEGAEAPPE